MTDRQQGGGDEGNPAAFALAGLQIGTEGDQSFLHELDKPIVTYEMRKGPAPMEQERDIEERRRLNSADPAEDHHRIWYPYIIT